MKLAFSTNAYTRFDLIEALRGIKAAGFSAVEILADVPHAYPDSLDSTRVHQIAAELERIGLSVSNVNANCSFGYWRHAPPEPYFEPSLISPNTAHRKDRTALIYKTLDFAHAINATNISITSGRCLGGMPPDRAAEQWKQSILPILDRADQLNLNVGFECEPGLFLEFAQELRASIDELQHPRLGANLDLGHCQVAGEDLPQVIRLLNDRIWNLHVEDIPDRKHYHLIPGEGSMPWDSIFAALRSIHYQRCMTVELYTHTANPQEAAEKSFAFLQTKLTA